jgi:Uncharacterised nucleotidyltransferase
MGRGQQVHATLLELADPRAPVGRKLRIDLSDNEWSELLALASAHGVLGIVLHNLGSQAAIPPELRALAERRWRAEWATTLRLRQLGRQVIEALSAANVPGAIFKGTDFADHLYPQATLRPTRDIDLLVPHDHWPAAGVVLHELGYERQRELSKRHEAAEYGEQCWRLRLDEKIAAELHWNLIRNPSLRRRASITFADLNRLAHVTSTGTQQVFTFASRMVIAAVHATFIHQFDRLLLLCDIREAGRNLAGDRDLAELREIMARTGTAAAVNIALGVTARLFGDQMIADLRQRLGRKTGGDMSIRLVSPEMVLYPPRPLNSFRRVLIREWLKRAA